MRIDAENFKLCVWSNAKGCQSCKSLAMLQKDSLVTVSIHPRTDLQRFEKPTPTNPRPPAWVELATIMIVASTTGYERIKSWVQRIQSRVQANATDNCSSL